jgi:hypothetical protein
MRKNPRRILSPQRLPFRHPGAGTTNLTNEETYCNTAVCIAGCRSTPVPVVVSVEHSVDASKRLTAAASLRPHGASGALIRAAVRWG